MALSAATITYDLSDYGLADFDSRRTKVWATNNVNGPVIDTEGNTIHLGSANGTVNADGTGSITVPTPGTGSNPASWQTTIHVDYPDRNADRGRGRLSLGPFTITVSANLADLVQQAETPPEIIGGDAWLATIDADDSSQYRAQQDERLAASYAPGKVARGAGIDPTGATDSTAAIQALIDGLSAFSTTGRVILPAGDYMIDALTLGPLVTLEGFGGDTTRFAAAGITAPRVRLFHKTGSTSPMLTVNGGATSLSHLHLDGNAVAQPLLYLYEGFESRIDTVRFINCPTTAILARKVNNNDWRGIFVDNCGSATEAAVIIKSPPQDGGASNGPTNTFDAYGLTIERSAGPALDIAWGATALTEGAYAEYVRLVNLHVESGEDTINGSVPNTGPMIRVGNVRSLHIINPFLYAGPSYVLEHDQTDNVISSTMLGSIHIVGGTIIGNASGVNATANLIHLVKGNDFTATGVSFGRQTGTPLKIESTYGQVVRIDPTSTNSGPGTGWATDARASHSFGWEALDRVRVRGLTVGTSTNTEALASVIQVDGVTAMAKSLRFQTGSLDRWYVQTDGATESGSNVGSDLRITARADAGTNLGDAVVIKRSTQQVTLPRGLLVGAAANTDAVSSSAYIDGAASVAKAIRFRNGGSDRWIFQVDAVANTGSNVGSDLRITARQDDGTNLGDAVIVKRSNMQVSVAYPVKEHAATTANRPTASAAGVGAHMFDTTIGKPIWSNGTNWVDATGAVV